MSQWSREVLVDSILFACAQVNSYGLISSSLRSQYNCHHCSDKSSLWRCFCLVKDLSKRKCEQPQKGGSIWKDLILWSKNKHEPAKALTKLHSFEHAVACWIQLQFNKMLTQPKTRISPGLSSSLQNHQHPIPYHSLRKRKASVWQSPSGLSKVTGCRILWWAVFWVAYRKGSNSVKIRPFPV